ncbi:hypothetical protein [Amycolatopsis australiensis]|uniref:Uncharacterized protein n=1 Tax=Amycolatopsis australiensis TaxID=546364 RepID=A0A1K1QNI9_9PSEU|nr:hypothetical protein [Amycolatopsis australiensis]SFW61225.1 hypothetical protein SAMN04489730_2001 [Amycolatopsis australiensis]
MTDHRDPVGARLDELLSAWSREIDEVPLPLLVDPVRAVDVVIAAKTRGRVHAPPDGAGTRPPGNAREERF